jgi:hypothetical protein
MNKGDKVTIAGLRIFKNGKSTRKCKKGMETVFTVKDSVDRSGIIATQLITKKGE